MFYRVMLFLLPLHLFYLDALIDKNPVCRIYTQNSILEHKNDYKPLFIGSHKRWATCTGAVWFHTNYLAVLNLYGRKITTYKFDPYTVTFQHVQEIDNSQGALLTNSENMVVSPDGSLLAVCSGPSHPGIKIYTLDQETHHITPQPILNFLTKRLVHNVRFTPDGLHIAVAQWDTAASLALYKISRNAHEITLKNVYKEMQSDPTITPKALNFTQDGRFAAIVYSAQAQGKKSKKGYQGMLTIRAFDAQTGILGQEISRINGNFCSEDLAFIDHDHAIVCSDQGNDALTIYPFDPVSGKLSNSCTRMEGSETCLSFPHGLAFKQDNTYLVVTNYGDDSFNLYKLM